MNDVLVKFEIWIP